MISKEEFILAYQNLDNPDKTIRDGASQFVLRFTKSDQAWGISQQLIYESQNPQIQFTACEVIYRKTKEQFQDLAEQQRTDLRTFIQKLMLGQEVALSNLSLNKICSTWALILLYEKSMWDTCLTDLIQLMQSGPRGIQIGLVVISQIAMQSKELRGGLMQSTEIQSAFLQQSKTMLEIFESLLQLQDINLLMTTLECLESWTMFGLQLCSSVSVMGILYKLCYQSLLSQNFEIFKKLSHNLQQIVHQSQRGQQHRNTARLSQIMSLIDPQEQETMSNLLELLLECSKTLITMQPQLSKKTQDALWFSFSDLVCKFSMEQQIFIFFHKRGLDLLLLMSYITHYNNRSISLTTFDFWIDFRDTLKKRSEELITYNLNPSNYWEHYFVILQPILDRCQLRDVKLTKKFIGGHINQPPKIIDIENGGESVVIDSEDSDDHADDRSLKVMKALDYREYAKDMFFAINQASRDYQGPNGQQRLFQILNQNMNMVDQLKQGPVTQEQFCQLITKTEVAFFVVQSILDDVSFDQSVSPIQGIIDFILNLEREVLAVVNPQLLFEGWMNIIVKTSLQIFYDISQQFKFTSETFRQIIQFILNYSCHEKLGPLASQALEAIGIIKRLPIDTEVLAYITTYFVNNHLKFFNEQHIENFISGLFSMTLQYKDFSIVQQIFETVFNKLQVDFDQISQQYAPVEFDKIINSILSTLNWITIQEESIQNTTLVQLPKALTQVVVQPLIIRLQNINRSDNEFMNKMVKFFKIVLKLCDYQTQSQAVEAIMQLSLQQVKNDPIKNAHWLSIISNAILRSDKSEATKNWIAQNLSNVNVFCNDQFVRWQDPDLVKYWVELLRQALHVEPLYLMNEQFVLILQSLSLAIKQINQYEMQREILLLFKDVSMKIPRENQIYQVIVPILVQGVVCNLNVINPALSTNLQHIFVYMSHAISAQHQQFIKSLIQPLAMVVDRDIKVLSLMAAAIYAFSISTEPGKQNTNLKLIFQNITQKSIDSINLMQLEMEVRKCERNYQIKLM